MEQESDEALLARYRNGEEEALTLLIARHLPGVYSFVARLAGAAEADDLTQEVFLKLWKNLGRFREEEARFKTWLYALARNAAIDVLRRRKASVFSSFETKEGDNPLLESLAAAEPLAEEHAIAREESGTVERALGELPAAYRETISLYYGGGFTFEEMARMLGISANTLKSRHRRAIAALRRILHPDGEEKRI